MGCSQPWHSTQIVWFSKRQCQSDIAQECIWMLVLLMGVASIGTVDSSVCHWFPQWTKLTMSAWADLSTHLLRINCWWYSGCSTPLTLPQMHFTGGSLSLQALVSSRQDESKCHQVQYFLIKINDECLGRPFKLNTPFVHCYFGDC